MPVTFSCSVYEAELGFCDDKHHFACWSLIYHCKCKMTLSTSNMVQKNCDNNTTSARNRVSLDQISLQSCCGIGSVSQDRNNAVNFEATVVTAGDSHCDRYQSTLLLAYRKHCNQTNSTVNQAEILPVCWVMQPELPSAQFDLWC